MNRRQKGVLIGAVVVVLLMLFFPPVSERSGYSVGYASIFRVGYGNHVNTGLLLIQWVGVAIMVGLLYLIFRSSK